MLPSKNSPWPSFFHVGLYVAQVLAYITTEDGGVTLYSLGVQPATHMNLIRAPPPVHQKTFHFLDSGERKPSISKLAHMLNQIIH